MEQLMHEVIRRLWPVAMAVVFIGGLLYSAYCYGVRIERLRWQAEQAVQMNETQRLITIAQLQARQKEHWAGYVQSTIEWDYLQRIKDGKRTTDHILAGVRDGRLWLRDAFRSCSCRTGVGLSSATTSTGERDAASGGGLPREHVEALVQLAGRAQATAEQLKAAQQVIAMDREICGIQIGNKVVG